MRDARNCFAKGCIPHTQTGMMDNLALDYLERLLGPLINPQKRIFVGYLLSALLIALAAAAVAGRKSLRQALVTFFSKKIWLSRSAIADYKILLINQAIMMGVAPRLISKLAVATLLFEALHVWLDGRVFLWPSVPSWAIAGLFTTSLFLLDDASKYLVHRALHRWPLLWNFHKVHHSAEVLTPLTVYRVHPVEGILFALRAVLVQAIAIAVFLFFFGDRTTLVTILGANVFLFFFNLAGSNLRHSHVWISYGKLLEHWLISPAQHQIHHSLEERHFDQNFGAVLAVWDRLGGSLTIASTDNKPAIFGVGAEDKGSHSLYALYILPVRDAIAGIIQPISAFLAHLKSTISHLTCSNRATGARSELKKTDSKA